MLGDSCVIVLQGHSRRGYVNVWNCVACSCSVPVQCLLCYLPLRPCHCYMQLHECLLFLCHLDAQRIQPQQPATVAGWLHTGMYIVNVNVFIPT